MAECDQDANTAYAASLAAAQPTIGVRSRTQITATTTFASKGGDPSVECSVSLKFKDSNGSGVLDPYEDWTKTPSERADDLLGRMSSDQKLALLAHSVTSDLPTTSNAAISSATQAIVTAGIRYGETSANTAALTPRATWSNNLQAAAESAALGVPFVLSSEPAHSQGNGRTKAKGFSQWPQELGLGALSDTAAMENYGKVVNVEYRAIGIRMALSPSADLDTDPRWFNGQFTFGEDTASVSGNVGAYIKGVQGASLGGTSVAAVVGHFPGSGAATGGWDSRLAKGKFLTFSGTSIDAHLGAFQGAFTNNVAGVMTSYGVPKTGSWSGLSGSIDGTSIEQVGASFNSELVTTILRGHYAFGGLAVAPQGVLEDAGTSPLGAPWGVEGSTKAQRIAKAISAGMDQFVGLNDLTALQSAKSGGLITDAQVNASAKRALVLMFQLGLFENPYVDPAQAPAIANSDANYRAGLDAQDRSMALIVNATKPSGWLNGTGDGTQTGDKGNAGNGTQRVLPAPPGEPYVSAGCRFYVGTGNIDLDYVRSVSAGYGELTNDETIIDGQNVTTEADKMAASDYVFIRLNAPCTADTDSGALGYCLDSLEYKSSENSAADASWLQPIVDARNAISSHSGSKTQIIVGVDGGRPSVVSEIQAYGVSGLYYSWGVTDKVFFDVAFGIVASSGTLPVGLPASDTAAAAQKPDVAADGQDATFVKGFGFSTTAF